MSKVLRISPQIDFVLSCRKPLPIFDPMTQTFSYDAFPYPSFTFPQTRPDRLSTIGLVRGIETALPDKCRVLELGCGDGTNLNSFAYCHPESTFLGIDLATVHINDANVAKGELGLRNVEFICGDVTELAVSEIGKFDFIIAHGLFSWVPPFVREHILRIYSECLTENGIGYLSYNAFPGFHLREAARGIMRYHAASIKDEAQKVEQAKTILGFVMQAMPDGHLHSKLIEREFRELCDRTPSNVFHDDLSEFNQAFYLHEFVEMLKPFGLTYVADTDLSASSTHGFSEDVRNALLAIAPDPIALEQYIDMIKMRRFRSSVICRADRDVNFVPTPNVARRFRIASPLKPSPGPYDLADTSPVKFIGNKNENIEANHPLTKMALDQLSSVWPQSIEFDSLLAQSTEKFEAAGVDSTEDDVAKFSGFLVQMFQVELINFHRFEPQVTVAVSDRPVSSRFARWQIDRGCEVVTTMTGMNLEPETDMIKLMIKLADGTRDISEIEEAIMEAAEVPEENLDDFRESLPAIVVSGLADMNRAGLLIA